MDGPLQSVIVDLSGLDFIDSCGITAIYRAVEASRANGTRLGLLRGSAEVERIFALTGLELPFLD
jgi:anti-anti-sigma factor